jgi:enamine deaminase RidA (YjgF/YER057c/UK114 family)
MQRKNFTSKTTWEDLVGYSRAVRVGPFVYVSGTTATTTTNKTGSSIVGIGDPYAQAVQIIKNMETALYNLGASLSDVVRTRIYVTDIKNWEKVGKAHEEFFREIRPAATLVQVSSLIVPQILVEMEADAVITITESIMDKS